MLIRLIINRVYLIHVNVADYGFSQDQAIEINVDGGIVAYLRKSNKLPSLDFIRAYQKALKNFCLGHFSNFICGTITKL
jgi:hypothetical protein